MVAPPIDWTIIALSGVAFHDEHPLYDGVRRDATHRVSEFGWDPDGRSMVGSLDGMMAEVGR